MKTEEELHLIYYLSTYFIENIFSSSSSLISFTQQSTHQGRVINNSPQASWKNWALGTVINLWKVTL